MRTLLLLAFLLLPSVAFGQDSSAPSPDPPIQDLPPGEDVIVPLRKGELAPFTGQLYESNTALRWAHWLQQYKYRLMWDVAALKEAHEVELEYRGALLLNEKERAARVETDLTERLVRSEKARLKAEQETRNPPWYSTTTFGVVVGALATAAVFGIAVAAIDATRPVP